MDSSTSIQANSDVHLSSCDNFADPARSSPLGPALPPPAAPIARAGGLSKTCEQCGCTFRPKAGTSASNFRERRFCSAKCASEAQKKRAEDVAPRYCEICSELIKKPRSLATSDYARRKYCSRDCRNTGIRQAVANKTYGGEFQEMRRPDDEAIKKVYEGQPSYGDFNVPVEVLALEERGRILRADHWIREI